MKNKLMILGIIALIAIIGLGITACKDGDTKNSSHTCAFESMESTIPADCLTAEVQTWACTHTGCNKTEPRTGSAALGHDWLYALGSTQATCVATGSGSRQCKREGCDVSESNTTIPIDPNNHDWNFDESENWELTTSPSLAADGEETRTCQRNGCTDTEKRPVEKYYAVTIEVDGEGTASSEPDAAAARNKTVTITAIADIGNVFKEWQVVLGEAALSNTETDTATFTMPGNAVTIKAVFEKLPITVSVTNNSWTYNGMPQGATVAYYGDMNDANAGQITVTYVGIDVTYNSETAPTNAGVYDVMVTTAGGSGYPAVTIPLKVGGLQINKIDLTWNANGTANNKEYDRSSIAVVATQPTLNGILPVDAVIVTVVNGTVNFSNMNVGTNISVIATGYGITGSTNYNAPIGQPAFANADITAKLINITGVVATNRQFIPGDTTVAITGGTLSGVINGDTVNPNVPTTGTITDANVGDGKAVIIGTISITGEQAGNYTLTQPAGITVNITKADGAILSVPVLVEKAARSIEIEAVTALTLQAVAYGYSKTNSAATATWQSGTTFSNLTPGTEYFIFIRAIGNSNYEEGVSGALIETTDALPLESFTIGFNQLQNLAPEITGPTLNLVGKTTDSITVESPELYVDGSIKYYLNGVQLTTVTGDSGETLNINTATALFSGIGTYKVTVEVIAEADSKRYSNIITITVRP